MRAWMMVLLFFALPVLGYAASVTELPDWKSTGYRVDFSSDDTGTTVVIGQTFPSAMVSFEAANGFSGNLYACDTKTFEADTCDLITALIADVAETPFQTTRTFYLVVVTTGDGSWLKIRGSHEEVIGSLATQQGFLIAKQFSVSTDTTTLGRAAVYECTDTTAARTLTVQSSDIASGSPEKPWTFVVNDRSGGAGTNNITVATEGAETIDGEVSVDLVADFASITLYSNGTNLFTKQAAANTNITDRLPSRISVEETEVFVLEDFPAAVAGVITLPAGVYTLKNDITLGDSIQTAAGAVVEIITLGSGPTLTYTGTGAFIQDNLTGSLLILNVINITLTGNGASLFDTNGTGVLIDRVTLIATGTGSSLGTSQNQNVAFSLRSSQVIGFVDGLTIIGSPLFLISDVLFVSPAAGGTVMFDVDSTSTFVQIDNITIDANVAEDIFAIDSSFTGSATITRVNNFNDTGFFEAGSLEEDSKFVTVNSSGMQKDSKNIGSFMVNDNTAATVIALIDTWVDLNLDAMATVGANSELWNLDSSTTGQLSYDGIRPFNGTLVSSIAGISSGAAQEFQFRVVINGSPVADSPIAAREFRGETGAVVLVVPVVAQPGDTVRIQVQNVGGTSNIILQFVSTEISWLFFLVLIPRRYYQDYAEAA